MSFKRFEADDITISADSITAPVWSTGITTLSTFFTSSAQYTNSNGFYLDVYQINSTGSNAAVQFSIAYANSLGSGSAPFNPDVASKTPSSVTYGQYRSLVLGDEEGDFTLNSSTLSEFYVLSIDFSVDLH